MPEYSWPPMDERKVIGKPTKRRDGLENPRAGRSILPT